MSDTSEQPNRFATDWEKIGNGPEPTSITFVPLDDPADDPQFDPYEETASGG